MIILCCLFLDCKQKMATDAFTTKAPIQRPGMQLTVNMDALLIEAFDMLKTIHTEIETITEAVNVHFNQSMDTVSFLAV